MRILHVVATTVALSTAYATAGDPKSVSDYFHESGRDGSFQGRAKEYGKLFPGELYRGTASQNTRLFGVMRFGDEMTARGEQSMNVFRAPRVIGTMGVTSTKVDFVNDFGGWTPPRCRSVYRPSGGLLTKIADEYGQNVGSCCGPSYHCEHLTDDCLPYLLPPNRPCALHDRSMTNKCQAPWYDIANQCVAQAHRDLETSTSDPNMAEVFHILGNLYGSPIQPPDTDRGRTGIDSFESAVSAPIDWSRLLP
jgi:hypothetical protein